MDTERLLDKIQKLLALAGNNPNKEEAETAMAKAQEMMYKHGISMDEMEGYSSDVNSKGEEVIKEAVYFGAGVAVNEYQRTLSYIIGKNFRCYTYSSTGRRCSCMVFLGKETDTKVCKTLVEYSLNVFESTFKGYLKNHKKLHPEIQYNPEFSRSLKRDYFDGFCEGMRNKFDQSVKTYALVVVPDDEVRLVHAGMKFHHVHHSAGVRAGDEFSYSAGKHAASLVGHSGGLLTD